MKYLLTAILFSSSLYGYESWIHRIQEYNVTNFKYTDDCTRATAMDIKRIFSLNTLKSVNGVEVDIAFHAKLKEVLIYHGSDQSKGYNHDFQCFNGKFVLLTDFMGEIDRVNNKLKLWLDLKNDNSFEIENAANSLSKMNNPDRFIVETKNYLGLKYLKNKNLKTSLWLNLSFPVDDSLSGQFRIFKNNMRLKFSKWLHSDYISHDCKKFLRYPEIIKNDIPKLCWNTGDDSPLGADQLARIYNLKVVLLKKLAH